MQPKRLSLIGVGLLGGSIGLAAKAASNSVVVTGYGHRKQTLQKAVEVGAIDGFSRSAAEAARDADLVILCTPVGLFKPLLAEIAPALSSTAIVTDVGSTKRSVTQLAQNLLPNPARFVGSHPMAGSEKRGIEFARADLFHSAKCILTPTRATAPDALETVETFWRDLQMQTIRMTPEQHDRLISDISHLPHALAAALMAMQSNDAMDLAGKGFLDTTRIAGGDGALWRDILQDNRDNVAASLRALRKTLDELEAMLDPARREELARWLDEAAAKRAKLLADKLRELDG